MFYFPQNAVYVTLSFFSAFNNIQVFHKAGAAIGIPTSETTIIIIITWHYSPT
jgi:hypothetical protein